MFTIKLQTEGVFAVAEVQGTRIGGVVFQAHPVGKTDAVVGGHQGQPRSLGEGFLQRLLDLGNSMLPVKLLGQMVGYIA